MPGSNIFIKNSYTARVRTQNLPSKAVAASRYGGPIKLETFTKLAGRNQTLDGVQLVLVGGDYDTIGFSFIFIIISGYSMLLKIVLNGTSNSKEDGRIY